MRFCSAALALAALAALVPAQATGTPGLNDLTVNGVGSGGTSCTLVNVSGSTVTLTLSGAPATGCALLFDVAPCATLFTFGMNFCTPGGPTPNSIDVGNTLLLDVPGTTDATGQFTFVSSGPLPGGFTFSVQGVILSPGSPCSPAAAPFLFTQAYDVQT